MSCIYVIRCANDKYYVGRTIDVVSRFNAHARGLGSKWCAAHLPLVGIVELHPDAPFQELLITLKTMQKYGVENVRGGPWVTMTLSATELETIDEIFRSEGFARKVVMNLNEPSSNESSANSMSVDEPDESRKGKKWDMTEDSDLMKELQTEKSIDEIAKKHKRSEGAIRSRIAQYVLMFYEKENKSISEISSLMHLSEQNVVYALHRKSAMIDIKPSA